MIHFACQHCGRKLKVPQTQAGRKGRCPACKGEVTVPLPSAPEPAVAQDIQLIPADTAKARSETPLNQPQYTAEDREEEHREERRLLTRFGIEPIPEYTGERKLPWPIDILLYPASGTGLTILALLIGIPLLLMFARSFIPWFLLQLVFGLPGFIGGAVVGLYLGWYLAECVYDSAKGGTRAPQGLATGIDSGELWSRVSYLLVVYIVYALPVMLYWMFMRKPDAILWALAAWAAVFFPMGLLAMVLHDSVSALNPLFLLGSILRTFFHYVGLAVLFAFLAVPLWLLDETPEDTQPSVLLDVAGIILAAYLPFILAHLLGRFYWRNRERLDWGV